MAPLDVAYPVMFRNMANRITLIYLLVGGGWILFSDRLLSLFVAGESAITTWQTIKGWLFVIVTDLLLYVLLLRDLRKIEYEVFMRGESETRAQMILANVHIGIVELDLSALKHELDVLKKQTPDLSQFLAANPSFLDRVLQSVSVNSMNKRTLEFLGADTEAQLLGRLSSICTPDSVNVFRDVLLALGENRGRFQAEMPLVTLKGEQRWGMVSLTLPAVDAGFANVPVSIIDITERKRTEETLLLFQLALQQIEEGITITTAELDLPGPEIVFVNAAFTRMTGYTAEEAIGSTPRILHGPKTDRAVLERVRPALWQRQTFHGRTVNYRKDGSEFLMDWYVVPLMNRQFRVTHFVAVQRDVTPKKEGC